MARFADLKSFFLALDGFKLNINKYNLPEPACRVLYEHVCIGIVGKNIGNPFPLADFISVFSGGRYYISHIQITNNAYILQKLSA
jgi:hypothetical protein